MCNSYLRILWRIYIFLQKYFSHIIAKISKKIHNGVNAIFCDTVFSIKLLPIFVFAS